MAKIHGFTSGTFDMFHIGHLKLLEAAAARCDYLTVGVNSDQLAASVKGHEPVMPFLERMEIVQCLRMVDNVVVQEDLDKMAAWRDLRFNIAFIGDNYRGTERWQETERDLAEVGVAVVYLPYTRASQSSALQAARLNEW